jgi:multidrug transporter EmrE-like cation transporter
MTAQGVYWVIVVAGMTVAGNLMMREGVVQAGGLSLEMHGMTRSLLELLQQPLLVGGVVLYGLASLFWFRVISTENLNSSYPLLVSLTFLFVTLGATLFFREPLSVQKIAGMATILIGIMLIATAR